MDAAKQTKTALLKNAVAGKMQTIFGWILTLFWLFCLIGAISSGIADLAVFSIIIILVGIVLIASGSKRKKLDRNFKHYVGLISSQHMTSIQALAQNTGQSTDKVIRDLKTMIDRKFFVNARLDANRNEIVVNQPNGPQQPFAQPQAFAQPRQNTQTAPPPQPPKTVSAKCDACGALNIKLEGASIACEYCGSPI
jgi:hypothetical protein